MERKTVKITIDKLIVILFFISCTLTFINVSISHTEEQASIGAPLYILLVPFGVAILQLMRVFMLLGSFKPDALFRSWAYIFLYYIIGVLMYVLAGQGRINYNVIWFIICPPVAWWYFSLALRVNPSLKDTLINLSFWVLLIFTLISLYSIPRSLKGNGLFASVSAGYYMLFLFPLVMLNSNRIKKTLSIVLMLLVVILSMKRGGYVVIALAFIFYILFATKLSSLKKLIVVVACIGALVYLIPVIDNMTHGTLTKRYEFTQNGGDEEGRVDMYPKIWNAVWESDIFEILVGHGINAVASNRVVDGDAAHNDYLEFLYDFGLIGLFLLLNYHWQLFKITLRSRKEKDYFFSTIFAFFTIFVLSMISIVYSFYYFIEIIPFWCIMNNTLKYKFSK